MNVTLHRRGVTRSSLPSATLIKSAVRAVLVREKVRHAGETNVVFVNDREIRRLNKQFLNEAGETDVIAFPYEKSSDAPLADVFVCVDEAARNARRVKEPLQRELVRLVVHGLLHVLGYDDHAPADRRRMWKRQEELVSSIFKGTSR